MDVVRQDLLSWTEFRLICEKKFMPGFGVGQHGREEDGVVFYP